MNSPDPALIDGTVVASSALFIAANAKDVWIDEKAVEELRDVLAKKVASHPPWSSHPLNPKTKDEATLNWIFVVDTLNFSFWTAADQLPYSCEGYTGLGKEQKRGRGKKLRTFFF